MNRRWDSNRSSAHASRALAAGALLLGFASCACVSSTAGATLAWSPGQRPGHALLDLEHLGKPPPAVPMCMEGERGCIETGWGPGWDLDHGREGKITWGHRKPAHVHGSLWNLNATRR